MSSYERVHGFGKSLVDSRANVFLDKFRFVYVEGILSNIIVLAPFFSLLQGVVGNVRSFVLVRGMASYLPRDYGFTMIIDPGHVGLTSSSSESLLQAHVDRARTFLFSSTSYSYDLFTRSIYDASVFKHPRGITYYVANFIIGKCHYIRYHRGLYTIEEAVFNYRLNRDNVTGSYELNIVFEPSTIREISSYATFISAYKRLNYVIFKALPVHISRIYYRDYNDVKYRVKEVVDTRNTEPL